MRWVMVAALSVWGFSTPSSARPRQRFPEAKAVEARLRRLETADSDTRRRLLLPFLKSLLDPRTDQDEETLASVPWRIGRLYQKTDDDAVLDAVYAVGFDAGPAETMHGGLARFLAQDPDFLRRHQKADRFVQGERGAGLLGRPARVPITIETEERDCLESERRSDHLEGASYLRAATDPASHVAVDGRDTALMTPIGLPDRILLGAGKHRITFTIPGKVLDVDIEVPAFENACVYRQLKAP